MTDSRQQRREHVCVPPRYPGKPSDYIYVAEHCRKQPSSIKNLNTKQDNIRNGTLIKESDIIIADLLTRLKETPEFIMYAVRNYRRGIHYDKSCSQWKGFTNFKKDKDVKAVVTALR